MIPRIQSGLVLAFMACLASVMAVASPVIRYRGRISVDGTRFSGTGLFAFVIHDARGAVVWRSGETPAAGSTELPSGVRRIPVVGGIYQVSLGDPTEGMPPLDAVALGRAENPVLRIWFSDGRSGWRLMDGVTPLASALRSALIPEAGPGPSQDPGTSSRTGPSRARPGAATPAGTRPRRTVTVSLGDSPSLGRPDAPVVLMEFTDYQCGFCRRFHEEVFPGLVKRFVDTGQLRIVSRNLPLAFHPQAEGAANAVLCAHDQGRFWEMRAKLFSNGAELTVPYYLTMAAQLGMDAGAFGTCLERQSAMAQVVRDEMDAGAAGITSTPSFVLGRPAGDQLTGIVLSGLHSLAFFEAELEKLLANKP